MFALRHQSLSEERRSCGALWGRDWTFISTGSQSRRRKKKSSAGARPPDLRGVLQLSQWIGCRDRLEFVCEVAIQFLNELDQRWRIYKFRWLACRWTS